VNEIVHFLQTKGYLEVRLVDTLVGTEWAVFDEEEEKNIYWFTGTKPYWYQL
jgi:hypothetical protein